MFMAPNVLNRGGHGKIRSRSGKYSDFSTFFNPCSRSVYPFTTPGAFVPHSAINLSRTKEEESPVSQSLDLSVSEAPSVSSAGA